MPSTASSSVVQLTLELGKAAVARRDGMARGALALAMASQHLEL